MCLEFEHLVDEDLLAVKGPECLVVLVRCISRIRVSFGQSVDKGVHHQVALCLRALLLSILVIIRNSLGLLAQILVETRKQYVDGLGKVGLLVVAWAVLRVLSIWFGLKILVFMQGRMHREGLLLISDASRRVIVQGVDSKWGFGN